MWIAIRSLVKESCIQAYLPHIIRKLMKWTEAALEGKVSFRKWKLYKSPSRPMCIVSPCLSWFSISYFNCLLVLIKEKTFKIAAWQLSAIQVHRLLGGVKQWKVYRPVSETHPLDLLQLIRIDILDVILINIMIFNSFLFPHCHDLSSLSIVRPQPMYTSLSSPPHLFTNFIITIAICFTCAVHQSLLKKIISFVDALPSLSFLSDDDEDERIIQYFWHSK